jgi:hypothetical protein
MVSILTNSFALLPMHLPSTHPHQFPTPTINTSTINTTPLVPYTTALQMECIHLTDQSTLDLAVGIIQIIHDFSTSLPGWYSNILPLTFNALFTTSTLLQLQLLPLRLLPLPVFLVQLQLSTILLN